MSADPKVEMIPISPETLKRTASDVFANPPKFPHRPIPDPKVETRTVRPCRFDSSHKNYCFEHEGYRATSLCVPGLAAAIKAERDRADGLEKALRQIRLGMEYECGCDDHTSGQCCIQAEEFCAFCISSAALSERKRRSE